MTNNFALTATDAHAVFTATVGKVAKVNKDLVSASIVLMLAHDGEMSLLEIKKQTKQTFESIGNRAMQQYVSVAGRVFRDYKEILQARISGQTDQTAKAVYALVNAWAWGDSKLGITAKWATFDEAATAVAPMKSERDDDAKAVTASNSVVKLLRTHSEQFSTSALDMMMRELTFLYNTRHGIVPIVTPTLESLGLNVDAIEPVELQEAA